MKHKFSWTQAWYGIAHLSPIERIANVESTVRDFNVGTQNLRFKILAVEPIKDGKYRRILPEWVDEYIARKIREYENGR